MEYLVTVQIGGQDVSCGRLFQNVRHGEETTTFSYDPSYLSHPKAFALCPDMPLGPGTFHSSGLRNLRAFEDCMPDRWGRNLLMRSERNQARLEQRTERTLFEADMLCGVSDFTRQGALRIWSPDGREALAKESAGVPREVELPALLSSADLAVEDLNADVRDLVAAGSSLGGARPKASIQDTDGTLLIAKFPKASESQAEDVCAWEHVCLRLMKACGIAVPPSRLTRIKGRSVLLLARFDRREKLRVPYISGLTAVQGDDGERYSYLELAEFIEESGSNPDRDLPELWRRAAFSCAVGNTDNHLRNYGFLWNESGWALSPAFDVNPTPGDNQKYLATALDFDRPEADPRIALEVSDYFRVSEDQAKAYMRKTAHVLEAWPAIARGEGISEASIQRMSSNFQSGIASLESTS
ncbi:MAG: type II toxin-antitoxin system HipA family toxin [Olsenella sp.]|jgi:serine/threonine-protein kinase HipA|nr:type II toxin-antitoxin system HipA family toxin [Olsenella sp.]MCI1289249.1 type II toxin-antitoxin system HipA family toxin [Olsenella sp.]